MSEAIVFCSLSYEEMDTLLDTLQNAPDLVETQHDNLMSIKREDLIAKLTKCYMETIENKKILEAGTRPRCGETRCDMKCVNGEQT